MCLLFQFGHFPEEHSRVSWKLYLTIKVNLFYEDECFVHGYRLFVKYFLLIVSRSLPLREHHPKSGQTASAVTANGSAEGDYDNLWQEESNDDMYAKVGDTSSHPPFDRCFVIYK